MDGNQDSHDADHSARVDVREEGDIVSGGGGDVMVYGAAEGGG